MSRHNRDERTSPTVDNEHVERGCEQFTPEVIAANAPAAPVRQRAVCVPTGIVGETETNRVCALCGAPYENPNPHTIGAVVDGRCPKCGGGSFREVVINAP